MRSGSRPRLIGARGLIGLLALAMTTGALASIGNAKGSCKRIKGPGSWSQFQAPAFSDGEEDVTLFDVSPARPRLVMVTNGREVQRSTDGGCSFTKVLSIADTDVPDTSEGAHIAQIEVTEKKADRIYVGISSGEATSRIHVFVSTNGGTKWQEATGLSEAVGSPIALAAAPSNPKIVYMLGGLRTVTADAVRAAGTITLYMSTDGSSWVAKKTFEGGLAAAAIDSVISLVQDHALAQTLHGYRGALYSGLAVDPRNPKELWIFSHTPPGTGKAGIIRTDDVDSGEFEGWEYWQEDAPPAQLSKTSSAGIDIYRKGKVYAAAAFGPENRFTFAHLTHEGRDWVALTTAGGASAPEDSFPAFFVFGPSFPRTNSGDRFPVEYVYTTKDGAAYYQRPRDEYSKPLRVNPTGVRVLDTKGWFRGDKAFLYGRDGNTFYRWES